VDGIGGAAADVYRLLPLVRTELLRGAADVHGCPSLLTLPGRAGAGMPRARELGAAGMPVSIP
jgi:hypothetical protein